MKCFRGLRTFQFVNGCSEYALECEAKALQTINIVLIFANFRQTNDIPGDRKIVLIMLAT